MNEYKENTIGWWLSQLKEPLKSRALADWRRIVLEYDISPSRVVRDIKIAIWWLWDYSHYANFWSGAKDFFHGISRPDGNGERQEGWDMAKKCAPDPEGVVLPRSVTEVIGNSGNTPTWNMSNDLAVATEKLKIDFLIEFSRQVEKYDSPAPEVIGNSGEVPEKPKIAGNPPRCITESERLHDALKRISELEKIIFRLLSNEKRS